MPNNHSVTIEDLHNGTYEVHVAITMTAAVKLIVNMDKDLPGATGELLPVQLGFTKNKDDESAAPESGIASETQRQPPPAPLRRRSTMSSLTAINRDNPAK